MSYYDDKHWNRCDVCGRFIAMEDFDNGMAIRTFRVEIFTEAEYYNTYHIKCRERGGITE